VELAVMMGFLIPILLFGLWEAGRMVEVSQILHNAAREGARQASTGQLSDTQVQTVVKQYLQNEGLSITNAAVTVENLGFSGNPTPPDNNPQNASDLDRLSVEVTVPFADVQWVSFGVVSSPSTQLSGSAVWSSVKDRAYPTPTPPAGF
jgi:Flp pilus assembly protein TadG